MSSRYEENRFRAQNTQRVQKAPYQPGDIQRRQQAAQDIRKRRSPVNDVRRQRYQQETLAGDWQQDWNRTPYDNRNDKRFTAGQFVLVLMIIFMTLALAAMALFWYTGRSSVRNPETSGAAIQRSGDSIRNEELPDDNIVILDMSSNE